MRQESQTRRYFIEVKKFVILTFSFSWLFFVSAVLVSSGALGLTISPAPLIVIGAFGPSLAAFALLAKSSSRESVKNLIKSGLNVRIPAPFYCFVAIIPLSIAGIASYLTGGREAQISPELPLVFIALFLLGGSVGEEFGWRGLALPRLITSFSPGISTIILGLVWTCWHAPLFWIEGTSQFSTPFWLYVPYILALSVQYTWIYLRTRGNLFACLLLHTFTNMTVIVFPLTEERQTNRFLIEVLLNSAVALIVLLLERRLFFSRLSSIDLH